MMENKYLIDKDKKIAIPFWYNNNSNTLCFNYYQDESSVPKKYKGNIISIETKLYSFTNEDGEKNLLKEEIIKFKENWSPSLITPKEKQYQKYKVEGLIPELTFSFIIYEKDYVNNPKKAMEKDTYTRRYLSVSYKSIYNSAEDGETLLTEKFSFCPHERFNCLEISVCYMAIASQLENGKEFLNHKALFQIMLDDGFDIAAYSYNNELFTAIQNYMFNFYYLPQKYKNNIIRSLRVAKDIMSNALSNINRFLEMHDY